MINLMSVVLLGFVLGMRHATDPDHVVAVTTIVSREPRLVSALRIGALWGVGHSLSLVLVGGAIIVFDVVIPPRLGLSMEFAVAVMLILLGVLSLSGVLQWISAAAAAAQAPSRAGDDGGARGRSIAATAARALLGKLRPLFVGVIHGLAGSAAVALLVLATIPSAAWAVVYLLVFAAGTVVGMMLITAANAVPFTVSAHGSAAVTRYLGVASGLASLGLGVFLAYRIGVVDGLFTGSPHWTPR